MLLRVGVYGMNLDDACASRGRRASSRSSSRTRHKPLGEMLPTVARCPATMIYTTRSHLLESRKGNGTPLGSMMCHNTRIDHHYHGQNVLFKLSTHPLIVLHALHGSRSYPSPSTARSTKDCSMFSVRWIVSSRGRRHEHLRQLYKHHSPHTPHRP